MEQTIDGYHTLSDGRRLYWRVDDFSDPWKRAPTVLLIHGFAETGEAWRAWVPHLARDYRVLRIDRRGFGKSDPMPADFPWSLDIMVDDTVSFIEAQSRSSAPAGAHVIGCKIATPLSIRLAVRCPDLVKSLVLCGDRRRRRTEKPGPARSRSAAPGIGRRRPWMPGWDRRCRLLRKPGGPSSWARPTSPPCSASFATWRRLMSAPKSAASAAPRWWLRPTVPIGRSRRSFRGKAGFRIHGSPPSRAVAFTPPRSCRISARRRRWLFCARSIELRPPRPRRREAA